MYLSIKFAFPLLIFFVLGCVAGNINADVDSIATNDSRKIHVVASMITTDVEKKIALFEGGVKIYIHQGFIISSDNAKFGYSNESRLKFIDLLDNAILIRKGEKIICDRIYIDCISGSIKYAVSYTHLTLPTKRIV